MGVDYRAYAGFGVKVNVSIPDTEEYEDYDNFEYLTDLLEGQDTYDFFEGGCGSYTGEDNDYYVYCSNAETALEGGNYNLQPYADKLIEFLDSIGLSYDDKPHIVGALHVY